MSNEKNLKPLNADKARELGKIGGVRSGEARRRKADMRKAMQAIISRTYTTSDGEEIGGDELIVMNILKAAVNPKDKNWAKAVDLVIKLVGADKSKDEQALIKAQAALLKAKVSLIEVGDTSALDKLDAILRETKADAERDAT